MSTGVEDRQGEEQLSGGLRAGMCSRDVVGEGGKQIAHM